MCALSRNSCAKHFAICQEEKVEGTSPFPPPNLRVNYSLLQDSLGFFKGGGGESNEYIGGLGKRMVSTQRSMSFSLPFSLSFEASAEERGLITSTSVRKAQLKKLPSVVMGVTKVEK